MSVTPVSTKGSEGRDAQSWPRPSLTAMLGRNGPGSHELQPSREWVSHLARATQQNPPCWQQLRGVGSDGVRVVEQVPHTLSALWWGGWGKDSLPPYPSPPVEKSCLGPLLIAAFGRVGTVPHQGNWVEMTLLGVGKPAPEHESRVGE